MLTPLALAVLLGACEAEGPGAVGADPAPDAATNARTGVSPSAAQLADDQTTTLRDAIAFASGDTIDAPAPSSGTPPPDAGATAPTAQPVTPVVNPLAVVPEPAPVPETTVDSPVAEPVPTSVATSVPEPVETPAAALPIEPDTDVSNGADTDAEPAIGRQDEIEQPSELEAPPIEGSDAEAATSAPGPEDTSDTSNPPPEPAPAPEPGDSDGDSDGDSNGDSNGDEADEGTTLEGEGETTPVTDSDDAGDLPRVFTSAQTAGFRGELREDGSVRITWEGDPSHRGYNVYRQSEFLTSVGSPELIEEDLYDGDYYYEIQAYHYDDSLPQEYVARGLTVEVRGTGRTDPDAPVANQDLLDGYDLVFADEFDTGVLDATKWNTAFLWGPDLTINSEVQYYVDILREPDFGFDPFTFEDGNLVINSVRTPDHLLEKAGGREYLSGIITSYDSMQFTYGYAEVRAKMPYGKGYWPAFWLLNAKYDGPNPEIDIMEFIGDNQDTVYHTYHYYDSEGVLRSTHSEPTKGRDYTAGFHTYGADWRPGLIVFYVDGVEVHRVSDPEVSRQDMYVIANTAMGGWWAGPPDETTPLPGRFEIDYIRVYRQTAPYEEPPLSDAPSTVAPASQVPGASPGHRPPFELWPEGYPGRF